MILIADSGSTKTNWCLIDEDKNLYSYSTQGINPYFQNKEEISKIITTELLPQIKIPGYNLNVFFYGAGCGSQDKNKTLTEVLLNNFKNSKVEVNNDLLAAAKALCGNTQGIVGILGTGSNTCYYDGKAIVKRIGGLGFIIGDEGSGAHIGKTFIQAYFNEELPQHISDKFYQHYKLEKEEILDAIYKKPLPNRFLASFAKFVGDNIAEEYLINIVTQCFEQFLDKHVCKYPQHTNVNFSCVGSIAHHYRHILAIAAKNKGVNISKIIKDPIHDLALYHIDSL